jgi:hypothetical protein
MVLSEGGSPEESANATPNQHFSMPLSTANNSTAIDDSEEWEYEYSTTETEVGPILSSI